METVGQRYDPSLLGQAAMRPGTGVWQIFCPGSYFSPSARFDQPSFEQNLISPAHALGFLGSGSTLQGDGAAQPHELQHCDPGAKPWSPASRGTPAATAHAGHFPGHRELPTSGKSQEGC